MSELIIPVVSEQGENRTDICFCNPHASQFGEKVFVDSPYSAKSNIKALDWEKAHQRWNSTKKMWEVDLEALTYCIVKLSCAGCSISITRSCLDRLE